MAKAYGKCKLCGADSFLNFAGLCKRCNSKKESSSIKGEILHDKELEKELKKKEQDAMPETKVETKKTPAEEAKKEAPKEESEEKAEDKKE